MKANRTKARVIIITAAALSMVSLATAGIALAGPDGKGNGTPGDAVDRAAYDNAVATSRASQKPQLDFLKSFEASGEDPSKLPTAELAASSPPQESVSAVAAKSDVIVLVEVVGLHYFGSGMGDLPATEVSYRLLSANKGAVANEFTVSLAGGPYKQSDGKIVVITLPLSNVESLGARSLAFLVRDRDGALKPTAAGSVYRLSSDGRIAVAPNATSAGIAGKSLTEVFAEMQLP